MSARAETLYSRDLLRLAASVPGRRDFAELAGAPVVRSPTCGSRAAARLAMDGARIAGVEQALEACAFGQASAHLAARHAPGLDPAGLDLMTRRLDDWLAGGGAVPLDDYALLDAARATPGRHGAILLPWRAIRAALAAAR